MVDFTEEKEIKKAEEVAEEIYKSTLKLGGTTTAEHGIGVEKGKWLEEEHKSSFGVMKMIKKAIDPKNIMNPGKMGCDNRIYKRNNKMCEVWKVHSFLSYV